MAATIDAYRPNLYSEWLLPQRPLIGCGISTICHADDLATLGEFTTRPDGRDKGPGQRKQDLMRGYRGFTRVADSNGIPDTDDYIRIHKAISDLPLPKQLWTRNWDDVMDHLKAGDVGVSIAVRLSVLGSRNTIDHTRADHQVLIWGIEKDGQTNTMGPMRAVSRTRTYHGHKSKLSEVRKAARAIEGGLILTWLTPIGGWTAEQLSLAKQQRTIATLRKARDAAQRTADNRRERIVALRQAIAELKDANPLDCDDPIDNARAATVEREMVALIAYANDRRTGAPDA